MNLHTLTLLLLLPLLLSHARAEPATWTADNGNGSYSNPLFYEDFSDPDLIRVGGDFYLTGSSMHVMPGLPVLHSTDLVNWNLASYAFDRLDLGAYFQLDASHENYGKGIWAPCLRYHAGTFYLFANVNGRGTQLFRAQNPAGPWVHSELKCSLHDLSVLFDDDGKVYVVWGYQDLKLAELNADFTDIIPGTERTLFTKQAGMGEGSHFYKIDGRYYIISALWDGPMRMTCARADRPEGPYEVKVISIDEDFGLAQGWQLRDVWGQGPLELRPPNPASRGRMSLHQGGIVATPTGEWWGFSMMDSNAIGRCTCLSPVTWQDGWPMFGLTGNLTRSPRMWKKPDTGRTAPPAAPFAHSDDFSAPQLNPVWQWNHQPDDTKWSLAERPGFLRLHSLPAADFWHARNTLTQHTVGPRATATTLLDVSALRTGDLTGLGLLDLPSSWIGLRREDDGLSIEQFSEQTGAAATSRMRLEASRVWLRVNCDFLAESAEFSFSLDGVKFQALGPAAHLVFQLKTFQGVRWSLFAFNAHGDAGGWADFDEFKVDEPTPRGLTRPIPYGQTLRLESVDGKRGLAVKNNQLVASINTSPVAPSATSRFTIVDRGAGRIALKTTAGFVSVSSPGDAGHVTIEPVASADAESFQWVETLQGDLMLLSLTTHCYLRVDPETGAVSADAKGPSVERHDGSRLSWRVID